VKYVPPQLQDDAYDLDESGRGKGLITREKNANSGAYARRRRMQPLRSADGRIITKIRSGCPMSRSDMSHTIMATGCSVDGRWYWAPPAPVVEVAAGPYIGFGWYPEGLPWISMTQMSDGCR